MEIKETVVSKLDRSQLEGNAIEFIELLEKQHFKKITLSCSDEQKIGVEIRAYFHDKVVITFEIGQENVYLKGTPFWSKDNKEGLIALIISLYHLE